MGRYDHYILYGQDNMKVVITNAHKECQFDAPASSRGNDILDTMCKNEGIQEKWYFGVMYQGHNGEEIWIEKSKKTLGTLKDHLNKLHFKVKYFPEDVDELIEDVTIEFFFHQLKKSILRGDIYCPADTCGLFASYALQAKHGDYDEETASSHLKNNIIPKRVQDSHSLSIDEWFKNISQMWEKHHGMEPEEAMLEYLKLAQNLDMYGVTYFEIKNKKGTTVYLGVTAYGLNIYKHDDKINPTINFPWSEIKHLKFRDRKFMIQLVDKKSKDFTFTTESAKLNKLILNLGIGNHTLYVRRRKDDTPDVVKLKEKTAAIKNSKSEERKKFLKEKYAKEEAERRERELQEKYNKLQADMEQRQLDFLKAQETIGKLSEQLQDLKKSKEELESQRSELQDMMRRLEDSKNLEAAERQKLEEEIRAKHDEVQRIQDEVQQKDDEARRLQEEVEEARRKEEEARQLALEEAAKAEEERKRREEQEALLQAKELEQLEYIDNTLPEYKKINESLLEQVKILQSQLNDTKKVESEEDRIHRENLKAGRDKFQTLRDIRSGNTGRRAELFENL